ncbi:unnamed protein product [Polarella glacialis]|uniref:Uncharacterized protein n=1 Tax=Polarella glacialis TaxID=89957 RepID=A0A813L270_POLGL|nr:unnamed protein product [Polarella glacialis]
MRALFMPWVLCYCCGQHLEKSCESEAQGLSGCRKNNNTSNNNNDDPSLSSLLQVRTQPADRCSRVRRTNATSSPISFHNFTPGYEGLYVHPGAKFAFCLIEKNACSHWSALMAKLEWGNMNFNGPYYGIASKSFSEEKADAVFRDPTTIRAAFEILLSAFSQLFSTTVHEQAVTTTSA